MAAAYGALVSVMQIIRQLQNHPFPPITLDIQQAESLTELVSSLQEFLEGYKSPFADSDEADPLEMRIADAAYAAEDAIESNIVDRILPHGAESQRIRSLKADDEKRNFKFDEEMVRRIPNVMRLGLEYNDEKGIMINGDYYGLSNVKCLSKLESLSYECVQAYDNLHMITFPDSLRKLLLIVPSSFDWEGVLKNISNLPHLQKLELVSGKFRGGEWETVEGGFRSLKSLTLSINNLEKWTMESSSHFPCLENLHLTMLKGLKEIPAEIGEIPTLQLITLYDCSESAMMSGRKIVEEQEELQGEDLPFKVIVVITGKKNQEVQSLANPNFHVV